MMERWNNLIFQEFDKPERVAALAHVARRMPERWFWKVFGEVWENSETLFRNHSLIQEMVKGRLESPLRGLMMHRKERQKLRELPASLTIFRGCCEVNRTGWSWSLNREKAEFFAKRYPIDGKPLLLIGIVAKADVFAYFDERNEDEIVVPTEKIRIIKVNKLVAPKGTRAMMGEVLHAIHSVADDDHTRDIMVKLGTQSAKSNGTPFEHLEEMFVSRAERLMLHGFLTKAERMLRHLEIARSVYETDNPGLERVVSGNIEYGGTGE